MSKIEEFTVEDVSFRDGALYCKIRDFVSVHPFVVPVENIFADEALMNKFKRRDLLRLQEMLSKIPGDFQVKVVESFVNPNQYEK